MFSALKLQVYTILNSSSGLFLYPWTDDKEKEMASVLLSALYAECHQPEPHKRWIRNAARVS